jgi:hypothetical protein
MLRLLGEGEGKGESRERERERERKPLNEVRSKTGKGEAMRGEILYICPGLPYLFSCEIC